MTRLRILTICVLLALAVSFLPTGAAFAQGTDEIKDYTIDIVPQDDGTLINTYTITWCVISDAAGPLTWFTIGMPNEDFEIISFNGDAATVKPDVSGFDYLMRIDLSREANAGDCVNASVQVHQYGMTYLDEEENEVSYQFTPGWFDEVPVQQLKITWALPADPAQIKSFDPQPKSQTETLATWETSLDEGDKFTLNLIYDRSVFPSYNPDQTVSQPTASSSTYEPNQSSSPSAEVEEKVEPAPNFFETISTSVCTCIIIIIIIVVLIIIFSALASSAKSYRGGSSFGGYRGGGSSSGGGSIFGSGGGSAGKSDRTGGGSGLFGGRGSSCACVSSGCACACAGGGRAGCSRKGFDVSGLLKGKKVNN